MLATLVEEPFDDDDWLFETKWDGVRALCTIREGRPLRLISRTGHSLTGQFPEFEKLTQAFRGLPVIVDGEIVTFDERGVSSFQLLQGRLNRLHADAELVRKIPVKYIVFDLLYAMGHDLRKESCEGRKRLLRQIMRAAGLLRFSQHRIGKGIELFKVAQHRGWEGVIGKRRDSPYRETRSRDWVKIKTGYEQEFVIGGWTSPRGSREHFGALLLGYYKDGTLQYAGHVGTGFDRRTLDLVMAKLRKIPASRSLFQSVPPEKMADAHWVRPHLVAEVKFGEWTRDGVLRQPVFLGLRSDKKPRDVVRERPRRGR